MRHRVFVLPALLLGLSLSMPQAPAHAWDWRPPEGEPIIHFWPIERLPRGRFHQNLGRAALAGLHHHLRATGDEIDLTGLDHGLHHLDYLLFDSNRPGLLATARALRLEVVRRRHGETSVEYVEALSHVAGPYGFAQLDAQAAATRLPALREALALARQIDEMPPQVIAELQRRVDSKLALLAEQAEGE